MSQYYCGLRRQLREASNGERTIYSRTGNNINDQKQQATCNIHKRTGPGCPFIRAILKKTLKSRLNKHAQFGQNNKKLEIKKEHNKLTL